ncbi:MAG: hypothetical protein CXT77_00040 [uncultured DHVE6 group euryarchaeote]|nr:MAG: hypothetical protein CXT77_00040 [uncultured DHVE6 group euryarchaeote]
MLLMTQIMGWFLISVGFLKIFDWKKFAENFAKYDLIAMQSKSYAVSYPLIELLIGASFLASWNVKIIAGVLLALMIVGIFGVRKALNEHKKVQCACLGKLGHKLNITLTKFTLIEDIIMGGMALAIILF